MLKYITINNNNIIKNNNFDFFLNNLNNKNLKFFLFSFKKVLQI